METKSIQKKCCQTAKTLGGRDLNARLASDQQKQGNMKDNGGGLYLGVDHEGLWNEEGVSRPSTNPACSSGICS